MKMLGRKASKERQAAAAGAKKKPRTGEREERHFPSAIPWTIEAQDPEGEKVLVHLREPRSALVATGPICSCRVGGRNAQVVNNSAGSDPEGRQWSSFGDYISRGPFSGT